MGAPVPGGSSQLSFLARLAGEMGVGVLTLLSVASSIVWLGSSSHLSACCGGMKLATASAGCPLSSATARWCRASKLSARPTGEVRTAASALFCLPSSQAWCGVPGVAASAGRTDPERRTREGVDASDSTSMSTAPTQRVGVSIPPGMLHHMITLQQSRRYMKRGSRGGMPLSLQEKPRQLGWAS